MKDVVPVVVAALVVGFAVGAIGSDVVSGPADSGPDPASPPLSLSWASVSCGERTPHAGWVHEVAVGKSFAVTLNGTVVHEPGRTVTANVSRITSRTYRIDLRTVPADRSTETKGRGTTTGDCTATKVDLGTSLPTDFERFHVTVNGRTILSVENEDTVGELYRLPNPINATDSGV